MPAKIIERVVADLRTRAGGDIVPSSDAALLDAFVARRDDAAFAALVQRHGPMVLGVCRRILGHAQDAEDAFQAVFWVLSRKASGIRPRAWVGNWLYGVAVRTALKARGLRRRRREHQVDAMPPHIKPLQATPPAEIDRDVQAVLDEEIERLPAKYRLAVVLCELQGRGRKEAAAQLGIPEGTLSSRLAYARRVLARRLEVRGATLGGTGVAALLGEHSAQAAVSQTLLNTTIQMARATGSASAAVATLAKGVMTAMLLGKLKKIVAVVVMGAAVLGLSFGLRSLGAQQETPKVVAENKAPAPAAEPKLKDKNTSPLGKDSVLGLWRLLRIEYKDHVEPQVFGDVGDVANKARVHIAQDRLHTNHLGPIETHKIKLGRGTFDLQHLPFGEDFTLGTYKLDGNRLHLYFGGTEEKSRPKGPNDALETWTLARFPSRQEIYQQLDRLQGRWRAVAGEFRGQAFLPRELENVDLWIVGDHWEMTAPQETAQPDAVPRTLFNKSLRFVLETTCERDYIVFKVEGANPGEAFVLYELRDNELKVCWDAGWSAQAGGRNPNAPGQFFPWNETPKEFKTAFGSDLVMFVLKRTDPTPPPPPMTPVAPMSQSTGEEAQPLKTVNRFQFFVTGPKGMKVRLFDGKEDKIAPARFTFAKPGTYRLRLSDVPDRPGKVYYPTIEIPAVTAPHAVAFLANSYLPLEFAEFDAADDGLLSSRYIILPDNEGAADAPVASGVQFRQTRPAADDKTTVLAIVRLGGIDLEPEVESRE